MMEKIRRTFIEPVFKGKRFENASMPHEILPDLEAYITIIIAIAKEIFKTNNPNKVRLPKGFDDRFKLNLTGIRPGSAIPVFQRDYEEEKWINDEFDQARQIVNEQIQASTSCIKEFPPELIPLFSSFGKNLKQDETIELRIPGEEKVFLYSKDVRSNILSINKKPYQDVCCISGSISGFDAKKGVFYLVLEDSEQLIGPLEGAFDIFLREIAAKYKREDLLVKIFGLARYNPDGTINQIERLQHIVLFQDGEVINQPDPLKRIDEFIHYDDGWFDGKGYRFNKNDLQSAKDWLSNILSKGIIPAPFIYPSPDKILEAEWSFGFWEIICSFDFTKDSVLLHATNLSSEEIREDKFIFNEPQSKNYVIRFLSNLIKSNEE